MLIFRGDRLLVRDVLFELDERIAKPLQSSLDLPPAWRGIPDWTEVDEAWLPEENGSKGGAEWLDLRAVWKRWGDEAFARVGTAYQYMNWLRGARFCPGCATPLTCKQDDRGLFCRSCGRVFYAPLHPAVIVAVERDTEGRDGGKNGKKKLLLAHNVRMPAGRYSVLAGFVEPGESLERTIAREIMEEVGIEVEDIRYFGSQSWPFPCSLMLGFTARWKKGELRPDGAELDDAAWFAADDLPDIPPGISISRRLIDDFISRNISTG